MRYAGPSLGKTPKESLMWAALFGAFRRGGASPPRSADSDFTFVPSDAAQGGGPACVPDAFLETPTREAKMGNAPSTVAPSGTLSPGPAPCGREEASAPVPHDCGRGAGLDEDAKPEGSARTDAESCDATTLSSRSVSEHHSEDGDAPPRQDVVSTAPPPSPSSAPCSKTDPVLQPGLSIEPHEGWWPPYPTGEPPAHWQHAGQTWPPIYSPLDETYAAEFAETLYSPECCANYYGGTYDPRAHSYGRSPPWLVPAQYGGTWGPDGCQVNDYAGPYWHHLPGMEWNSAWEDEDFGPWVSSPYPAVPPLYAPPRVWL